MPPPLSRRAFIKSGALAAGSGLAGPLLYARLGDSFAASAAAPAGGGPYFVAPGGSDENPGTLSLPFASPHRALQAVRQRRGPVFLRGGTYYLPEPLVFTEQDSGTKDAPLVFSAYPGEHPVISGGIRLEHLDWQPYRDGILQAKVPATLATEEIFINGERQVLARYPNFNPKAQLFRRICRRRHCARARRPLGGSDRRLLSRQCIRPSGRLHLADHRQGRGGRSDDGGRLAEQPWRGRAPDLRFVENIFEELDAPGEWFLDRKTQHPCIFTHRRDWI